MANYRRKRRKAKRLRQQGLTFRADLHMHTTRSDGIHAPGDVLEACGAGKLDLVAITDHDIGPEAEPGWHCRADHRFYLLHGAEISGMHEGKEYHLLVYFPAALPSAFQQLLGQLCAARVARYDYAIERLRAKLSPRVEQHLLHSSLPFADEAARSGRRSLTRTHLARGLLRCGVVRNFDEAFSHFLRDPDIVPPLRYGFCEAIVAAKAAGAFTSWAHPPIEAAEKYTRLFASSGLDALEVIRPRASSKSRKRLRQLAQVNRLNVTGGSDSHGYGKPLGQFACLGFELKWISQLGLEPKMFAQN